MAVTTFHMNRFVVFQILGMGKDFHWWENQKFKFKFKSQSNLGRTYLKFQIQNCKLTMTRTQIAKQTHVDHHF